MTEASSTHRFVATSDLKVGDQVVCRDGTVHEVRSVEHEVKVVLRGLGVFTWPSQETVLVTENEQVQP